MWIEGEVRVYHGGDDPQIMTIEAPFINEKETTVIAWPFHSQPNIFRRWRIQTKARRLAKIVQKKTGRLILFSYNKNLEEYMGRKYV